MNLDLNDLWKELQFNKPKISDREGSCVVIGVGIAEKSQKFIAVREHPFAIRGSQNRKMRAVRRRF